MQFVLLMYGSEPANLTPEGKTELHRAVVAFTDALHQRNSLRGHHEFHPSPEARTLRAGKVENGPATGAASQLKGYYLIDVPDLHSAIEWAKRVPGIHDAVEIRPVAS
jgi:hypothetical protein